MKEFIFDLQRFATLSNVSNYSLVSGTSGDDTINNDGDGATIDCGDGNDYVWNTDFIGSGDESSINLGNGNDIIHNFGDNVTVVGGKGNDSIGNNYYLSSGGNYNNTAGKNFLFKYTEGDGNDLIGGFRTDSTLSISGGSYSTAKSGNNIIVTVGDGKISLLGAATLSTVNIKFESTGKTLSSSGSYTSLIGGSGNDSFYNKYGFVTIDSGYGNDTIFNDGVSSDNCIVKTGPGNDSYRGDWADYCTINTGTGNDTINLKTNVGHNIIQYNSGDGNDIISGFLSTDTLSISGDSYSSAQSGSDIIVTVGDGKISLLGAATLSTVNIKFESTGKTLSSSGSYTSLIGGSGNDSLYNKYGFVTIDSGDGNDTIFNDGVSSDNCIVKTGAGNDSYRGDWADYCTINTGTGNDTINLKTNVGHNIIQYNSGDGNDIISGFLSTDTLSISGDSYSSAQSGSDIIVTVGSGVVTLKGVSSANIAGTYNNPLNISLTSGNDNYTNTLSNATINALGGNDTVYNYNGDYSSINAGDGADSIDAYDNDYVTVSAGAGNDTVTGYYYWSKIDGGAGNDKISIGGYSNTIDAGAGNDLINITHNGSTVKGGTGNDTISLSNGSYNDLIQYTSGDGNDVIYNFQSSYDTLKIGNGTTDTYCSVQSGSDIIVTVGSGVVTLKGVSSANIAGTYNNPLNVFLTSGADNYTNTLSGTTIMALAGNDSIYNTLTSVKIDGGAGNDSIKNWGSSSDSVVGSKVTIIGGEGDDDLFSIGNYVTINAGTGNDKITIDSWVNGNPGGFYTSVEAGDGNDTIRNYSNYVTINGGAGKDFIVSGHSDIVGKAVTVNAGTGDDTVSLVSPAKNHLIQYASGDGNDIVYGLNSTSTLKIGNGTSDTYSKSTVSGNVLVSVGSGVITLDGAASLSKVNILGTEIATNKWTISGTTAKYGTSSKTLVTVKGLKKGLQVSGGEIQGISLSGNVVTLSAAALGTSKVTISGTGYTLNLDSDVPESTAQKESWTLDGSTATYKSSYKTAGYTLANNAKSISYSKGTTASTLATVEGLQSGLKANDGAISGINVSGKEITLSAAALGTSDVKVSGEGYTLKLGSDVKAPKTTKTWSLNKTTATYKETTSAGYTLGKDSKTINYAGASNSTAKVTGLKSGLKASNGAINGINVSGKEITLSAAALGTSDVKVSGEGYTLKLGSDVKAPKTTKTWSLDNATAKATYNQTTTAGYKLSSNAITHSKESSKTLATVSGVKSLDGISLSGTTVTVKKASLGTSKVTISDGYTLKLGSDVKAPKTTKTWSLDNATAKATYNQTTTAGYKLSSNAITHSKESSKTLATVSGVKSLDGISLSGTTVTVKKASLGTSKVTISDGYTLKLGSDVDKPTSKKSWSLNGTTATYNQTTTAGYKLSSNAITHSKESSKTLATIKGLKSGLKVSGGKISGISESGKVITLSAAVLGTSKVTLSGEGYTLNLGDVDRSTTKKAAWSLKNSTATYKSSYKTAGYTLASDSKSISYSKATTAETLASIKGAASTSGLSVSGKKITLKNSALNKKVTVSGGYEFDFASDYKSATITGSSNADSITANGTKVSINGGAGDDTIKVLGSSSSVTGGKGADLFIFDAGKSNFITDYAPEDKISITSGTAKVTTNGDNVIFTVGTGKITVKGGKDKTITYSDDSGKNKKYKYEEPVDDETVILPKNYSKETYTMGDDTFNVDASKVRLDIEIVGNKFANEIIGSSQNDTIIGGKANDTLYGGAGADVFVWNKGAGNDVISDYSEEDTILVKGGNVKESSFKTSSDDLIINLASKSKITVKGGAYRVINYKDAKGEHVYSHFVEFDEEGIEVTLKSNYPEKKSFEASYYADYAEELAVIDASEVVHKMNIVGNSVANSIKGTNDEDTIDGGNHNDTIYGMNGDDSLIGGAGKDYLYGGEGNDTLWGGKGNDYLDGGAGDDVFVFDSNDGNDTINSYEQGLDRIMILSGEKPALVGTPLSTDVKFKVGSGTITVNKGANTTIEFIKSNGDNLYTYIPSK